MHNLAQNAQLTGSARADSQKYSSSSLMAKKREARYPQSGGGLVVLVVLVDFLVIAGALSVAWWLRFYTPLVRFGVEELKAPTFGRYSGHIVLGAIVMVLVLVNFRAYDCSKLLSAAHELRVVFFSAFCWLIVFLALSLIFKIQPSISRVFSLVGSVCIVVGLSYWRLIVTHYIVPHVADSLRRRTLLIGWTGDTEQIVRSLRISRSAELEIAGILLPQGAESGVKSPPELPVLGDYSMLESILREQHFDSVLVGDPDIGKQELSSIAGNCEREMVGFELIPNCFPALLSGLSVKTVHGVPVLGVSRLPLHSNLNIYAKRFIDIVGALVGIVLSAPAILIFGWLIYRESPGFIFYRQWRLGLAGRPFQIIKLRSMTLDAEMGEEPGWTVKDDPRCLSIGRFIRKWNIDELPQFWNVLKGEMSLIGPRPERPEFIEQFKTKIPHYNARHNIKPGITGWAQVNGLRGDTDLAERVRYDLHYIENWNFFFDLYILARTLFSRKGAC